MRPIEGEMSISECEEGSDSHLSNIFKDSPDSVCVSQFVVLSHSQRGPGGD